ncbi:MAG: protein kinase [Isosphaeraceae bacterium]
MIPNDREPSWSQNASAEGTGVHPSSTFQEASLAGTLERFLGLVKTGRRPNREEFLAQHGDDRSVLADCLDGLEFLLSAAPALAELGDPSDDAPGISLGPTSRLGDYRIVREIGRGGMGVVYEAEQVSLGRRVALKILPLGAALDPRQRQRFRLEAQAAAHLHHPHIVPVHAFGRDQGVLFFAMQFIEGGSLADALRDLRNDRGAVAPGRDPNGTTPGGSAASAFGSSRRDRAFFRRVAELGVQAAEALEHAHALGVVHRDVKPGNLLIDQEGALWVADFGLARLHDEPGLTRTGDVLGTLAYMSPEQARGLRNVDSRADVYSLGATLYELATLRPPFEGRERQEVIRAIVHDDPVPPRKRDPAIPRDLETVILKAMEKEPNARYPSARALADDLGRFPADVPILARRPGPVEQAARWVRRHKAVVATAAMGIFDATLVALVLIWRESQATHDALTKVQYELRRQRDLVASSIRAADQITYAAMGQLHQLDPTGGGEIGSFYREALRYYENVAAQDWDDPAMRSTRAAALRRVGFIRMILRYVKKQPDFQNADAEGAYAEALAVAEEVLRAEPDDPRHREDLVDILGEVAQLQRSLGGTQAALPYLRRRVEALRPFLKNGTERPSRLAKCAGAFLGARRALLELGRTEEADSLLVELRAALDAVGPSATPERREDAAKAEVALARELGGPPSHDRDEAATRLRHALILRPRDPVASNRLAWLLASRPDLRPHDPDEAVMLASLAVEAGAGREAWNTLGVALYRRGDLPEARNALEKSIEGTGGTPHDWLFLAMIDARREKPDEARAWYDKAVETLESRRARSTELDLFRQEAARALGLADGDPSQVD